MSDPQGVDRGETAEAIRRQVSAWEIASGHVWGHVWEKPSGDVSTAEAITHALEVIDAKGKLRLDDDPWPVVVRVAAAVIYLSRGAVRKRYLERAELRFRTNVNIGATFEDIHSDTFGAVLGRLADPDPDLPEVENLEGFFTHAARNLFLSLVERAKAEQRIVRTFPRAVVTVPAEDSLRKVDIDAELLRFVYIRRRLRPQSWPQLRVFARTIERILANPERSPSECLVEVAAEADGDNTIAPSRATFARWLGQFRKQIRKSDRSMG
jgi:hypothetical protein